MRDEQVHRYARHILLPDVGGIGQDALIAATARIDLDATSEGRASEAIAATYLVAGGVGAIVLRNASDAQLALVATHGPDARLLTQGDGRDVEIAARPTWWPSSEGDATALAFWRGGLAATTWMAAVANPA